MIGANRKKYERVRLLSEAMSGLRSRVTRDLRGHDAERRAIAIAVRLIDATGMRLGDERYARERGTIGTLTLQRQHTTVQGVRVFLDFSAKSGVRWMATIVDEDLAAALRRAPRSGRRPDELPAGCHGYRDHAQRPAQHCGGGAL